MANVREIVLGRERLLHQSDGRMANPALFPGLIRPANAKGEIRFARGHDFIQWPFQDSFSREPVVVVAESVDSELSGQIRLGLPGLRIAQVVEAKIGWQMRLVVSTEAGPALHYVRPFGKAFTPPSIVVG